MKARAKKTRRPAFLWITDPWVTLDHANDTTLRLAQEAARLGFESHWADARSLRFENARVLLDVAPVNPTGVAVLSKARPVEPRRFGSIHYRVDPPIDLKYSLPLQLLALGVAGSRAAIVNPPEALLLGNEKLEAALAGDLLPPTTAASRWEVLDAAGRAAGKLVLKPLFQAQGKGVELLDWTTQGGRDRAHAALSAATDRFTRPAALQAYLPGIEKKGELRLWFIDGRLLAAAKKFPLPGDFRVNIDRGSRVEAARPTARQRSVASKVGRRLRARGVRLAAIDLIDDRVTDFNITSPGLLTQIEAATGENLAAKIIAALARGVST